MTEHPSSQALALYVICEGTGEAAETDVAAHVASCERCREVVRLAASQVRSAFEADLAAATVESQRPSRQPMLLRRIAIAAVIVIAAGAAIIGAALFRGQSRGASAGDLSIHPEKSPLALRLACYDSATNDAPASTTEDRGGPWFNNVDCDAPTIDIASSLGDEATHLLLEGRQLGSEHSYPRSEETFRRALAAWEAFKATARTPADRASVEYFDKRVRSRAYAGIGKTMALAGNPQAAVENLYLALDLDPDVSDAWFTLGASLAKLPTPHLEERNRLRDQEIAAYQHAVALDDHNFSAWRNMGVALTDKVRSNPSLFDELIDDIYNAFKKAYQLRSDDYGSAYGAGLSLFFLQRWSDAREPLTRAVALKPNSHNARVTLGRTALHLNDPNLLIDQVLALSIFDPDQTKKLITFAAEYLQNDDSVAASRPVLAATIYALQGKINEAQAIADQLRASSPEQAAVIERAIASAPK